MDKKLPKYCLALRELMSLNGISNPNQLAVLTGMQQPVIRRLYLGEVGEPRAKTVQPLADYFKVDVEVLRGLPIPLQKQYEQAESQARHQYEQSHGELKPYITDNQVQIPILNIEASGGMGAINDSELVTDNMTLEKSYLHEFGLPVDNLKIITIRGDSMSPELESGDLVLVHHVPIAAHEMHDGMFVVLIEEMLYIKRLQRLPGKRIKVISTNREAYDPFEVTCNDIDIIGRVVFAWRGKKF